MDTNSKDKELEDLIAAAQSNEVPTAPLTSAERFLTEFPIRQHKSPQVTTEVIFHFFNKFCKEKGIEPTSKDKFFKTLRKAGFRNIPRDGEIRYYVDREPFFMTDEEYEQMRFEARYKKYKWENVIRENRRIGKEKVQKRLAKERQQRLKERLEKKHRRGTKSETSGSTDGSSQK